MDSFFARYKNPLVLVAVLLVQIIGLAVQVRPNSNTHDGKHVRFVRLWAGTIAWPFEKVSHSVGHDIGGAWSNYIDLRSVRKQNQELKARVGQLEQETVSLSEDAKQGHRLQALLQFQQQYTAKTVAAQVIGTSGSDQSPALTIDKGSADGIRPDMAVITPDGVVGKVRLVFSHTAQVLELNDATSGAGVILESSRIRAIVRGTAIGRLQISDLTQDDRIKPGERVLTSGGDQVYPRGLNIGTIESIKPDPDHQPYTAIVVRSAAKLDQLEEVLIIVETQSQMPAQMQQDLSVATDIARAATAAAERLPDIGGQGTTTATTGPGQPPPGPPPAPKPLPALHTDRFSPGATPPATSLTPGGNGANGAVNVQPKAALAKQPNAGDSEAQQ